MLALEGPATRDSLPPPRLRRPATLTIVLLHPPLRCKFIENTFPHKSSLRSSWSLITNGNNAFPARRFFLTVSHLQVLHLGEPVGLDVEASEFLEVLQVADLGDLVLRGVSSE